MNFFKALLLRCRLLEGPDGVSSCTSIKQCTCCFANFVNWQCGACVHLLGGLALIAASGWWGQCVTTR